MIARPGIHSFNPELCKATDAALRAGELRDWGRVRIARADHLGDLVREHGRLHNAVALKSLDRKQHKKRIRT